MSKMSSWQRWKTKKMVDSKLYKLPCRFKLQKAIQITSIPLHLRENFITMLTKSRLQQIFLDAMQHLLLTLRHVAGNNLVQGMKKVKISPTAKAFAVTVLFWTSIKVIEEGNNVIRWIFLVSRVHLHIASGSVKMIKDTTDIRWAPQHSLTTWNSRLQFHLHGVNQQKIFHWIVIKHLPGHNLVNLNWLEILRQKRCLLVFQITFYWSHIMTHTLRILLISCCLIVSKSHSMGQSATRLVLRTPHLTHNNRAVINFQVVVLLINWKNYAMQTFRERKIAQAAHSTSFLSITSIIKWLMDSINCSILFKRCRQQWLGSNWLRIESNGLKQ